MSRLTARTRPRKLAPRQNIQILREDQVDSLTDFDSGRGPIETGVEKAEESEYHLQQAIKASQTLKADTQIKDGYIPTPPTIASDVQYDVLYPKGFQQPATYIRSSATVEDCAGVPYCMDEDDEIALKQINARLPAGQPQISEDSFEEVINIFEETAQAAQPFAVVDGSPVLPLEELKKHFDDTHPEYVQTLSEFVYEHWSSRRNLNGNRGLAPHLKFETGQENDDFDPYVCFRRRELRQIRKTRNRDAQSAEKLRKLRLELESARSVLLMVKRREQMRRDQLELDRQVFEQRMSFRDTKRKLGIKGDEDLLINQKKPKLPQGISPNQAALANSLRLPIGAGAPGAELRKLEEVEAEKQRGIMNEIDSNIVKHQRWNEGFVDKTRFPLTPDSEPDFDRREAPYRQAIPAMSLPTPPASHSDEDADHDIPAMDKRVSRASTPAGYFSPAEDSSSKTYPRFRRRVGRGNRTLVDRKLPWSRKDVVGDDDPFKYDNSDDSDIEETHHAYDDRDFASMSLKGLLFPSGRQQQQIEAVRRTSEAAHNPAQQPTPAQQQIAGR